MTQEREALEARHREVPTLDPSVTRCSHDFDSPPGFEDDLWPCDTRRALDLATAAEQRERALVEALGQSVDWIMAYEDAIGHSYCKQDGFDWLDCTCGFAEKAEAWRAAMAASRAALDEPTEPVAEPRVDAFLVQHQPWCISFHDDRPCAPEPTEPEGGER